MDLLHARGTVVNIVGAPFRIGIVEYVQGVFFVSEEGYMPGTESQRVSILGEYRLRQFGPGVRRHQVAVAGCVRKALAVVGGDGFAG